MEGFPNCHCNELAVLKTSWTIANPGRRFLGCPNYDGLNPGRSCGFFFWYDAPVQDRAKEVINGLLGRLNNLEREKNAKESKEKKAYSNNSYFGCSNYLLVALILVPCGL
ncbi:GRF zinc finger protein [Rhynchospora pubera]|uniref:GRF zinc finger protein n=1 Tax=Rhynchospora pubera TaxID=906938 RepID=A0AAV8H8Y7_9POAL|nr:GRF zinc finger protein [Rhynchospora pubera]